MPVHWQELILSEDLMQKLADEEFDRAIDAVAYAKKMSLKFHRMAVTELLKATVRCSSLYGWPSTVDVLNGQAALPITR